MNIKIIIDISKGVFNAFQRRVLKKYPIEPMMKQREKRIFEEVIKNLNPKEVLEWGSGYSTLYFPKMLPKGTNWLSIEHDKEWYRILAPQNKAKNVDIKLMEHNENWKKNHFDGSYEDFREYIEYPLNLKKKFNLIIIDGRARKECFKVAKKILSKDGVIIIHDANRKYYYDDFKFRPKQKIVFNDIKSKHGGIFLYNEIDIGRFLDIKKHKKIWKKFNKIEKIPLIGNKLLRLS